MVRTVAVRVSSSLTCGPVVPTVAADCASRGAIQVGVAHTGRPAHGRTSGSRPVHRGRSGRTMRVCLPYHRNPLCRRSMPLGAKFASRVGNQPPQNRVPLMKSSRSSSVEGFSITQLMPTPEARTTMAGEGEPVTRRSGRPAPPASIRSGNAP
jgi:hypothetical protein